MDFHGRHIDDRIFQTYEKIRKAAILEKIDKSEERRMYRWLCGVQLECRTALQTTDGIRKTEGM